MAVSRMVTEPWVESVDSPMLRRRTLGKSLGLRVPAP